jgi:hypothetical protein
MPFSSSSHQTFAQKTIQNVLAAAFEANVGTDCVELVKKEAETSVTLSSPVEEMGSPTGGEEVARNDKLCHALQHSCSLITTTHIYKRFNKVWQHIFFLQG